MYNKFKSYFNFKMDFVLYYFCCKLKKKKKSTLLLMTSQKQEEKKIKIFSTKPHFTKLGSQGAM